MLTRPRCMRHPLAAAPARGVVVAVLAALAPLLLAGCTGLSTQNCETADTACDTTDADADGYSAEVDCDETNPEVNPGATEVCDDGIDNDCDEVSDTDDSNCQ